jgi:acetolactate synthase-1/2/3 large subunit
MLTKTKSRGADALARALKDAGVKRIFTLSGNHIMAVFDALYDTGIELVHTRHEAAAVHMADAYARVSGDVGVALVTGGPGHANAVGALYTARMSESPVILISGHAPNSQLGTGAFQEIRQADMAAPVAKAAWTSKSADDLASDLARAARTARGGRPGPVNLNVPSDAIEAAANGSSTLQFTPEEQKLSPEDAKAIVERLARAARPLVLAGVSCLTRRGRERLAALEAECGVPVIGMESPRGMADPALGAFAEALAKTDCVLLLGKKVDFTIKFGKVLPANCEFLQVDPEQQQLELSRQALGARLKMAHVADALPAAEALRAQRAAAKPKNAWVKEVRDAVAFRPAEWSSAKAARPDRVHPVQAVRPLQAILDSHPDSIVVLDGGEFGQWVAACLNAPYRVVNGVAGAIGASLPFAIGARCANRDAPIVAVLGDGTFGFHAMELDTAVTHKLPFVAMVGNDARWNAEYQIQLREYGHNRAHGCEMREQRYDQIARAFGAFGERITSADQVAPAAQRAMASGLPACLEVMIEGIPAPQLGGQAPMGVTP